MKSILIRFGVVAAIGLVVFAAACGGDDDDEGADSTPESQATSAATAVTVATRAAEPTDAPDDGGRSSGQQQFSEMSAEDQTAVDSLCTVAADPVAGLSSGINLDVALQAAQAGQFGPDFVEPAESFSEAYAGTDPAAFDTAATDVKAVCDDIGWTAQ